MEWFFLAFLFVKLWKKLTDRHFEVQKWPFLSDAVDKPYFEFANAIAQSVSVDPPSSRASIGTSFSCMIRSGFENWVQCKELSCSRHPKSYCIGDYWCKRPNRDE